MALITRRNAGVGGAAVLVLVLAVSEARAQQFIQTGKDTLRGLPGVEVLVEPLAPELERAGLMASAIHANVERYLREHTIQVYANQTGNPSEAKPYLYVQVSGLSLPRQGYALAVDVQVRQTLRSLVTGSAIVNAMSWDQQIVMVVLPGDGMQAVHAQVQTLVDQFVQDWRAVH
jgi:hypothetical protein